MIYYEVQKYILLMGNGDDILFVIINLNISLPILVLDAIQFPDPKPIFPDPKPIFPDPKPIFPDPKPIFPDPKLIFPDPKSYFFY